MYQNLVTGDVLNLLRGWATLPALPSVINLLRNF